MSNHTKIRYETYFQRSKKKLILRKNVVKSSRFIIHTYYFAVFYNDKFSRYPIEKIRYSNRDSDSKFSKRNLISQHIKKQKATFSFLLLLVLLNTIAQNFVIIILIKLYQSCRNSVFQHFRTKSDKNFPILYTNLCELGVSTVLKVKKTFAKFVALFSVRALQNTCVGTLIIVQL